MNKEICIKKIRNSTNASETNAPIPPRDPTKRRRLREKDYGSLKKSYSLSKKDDGSSKKGYYFFKKLLTLYLVNL